MQSEDQADEEQENKQFEPIESVNLQSADTIDWSRQCLPIGVKTEGEERPWLELDEEDLLLLNTVLCRPLIVIRDDVPVSIPPLATRSDALRKLGEWARIAADWKEKHG